MNPIKVVGLAKTRGSVQQRRSVRHEKYQLAHADTAAKGWLENSAGKHSYKTRPSLFSLKNNRPPPKPTARSAQKHLLKRTAEE
ncbi:hypothetical protein FHS90_000029 [Rufibacter quisquiliarum]|uniref:Uncharacterized protein n=1 Tax=Rufibacter quisquiliarum TaxID=1549639 RepID=A0A839G8L1_9BACT|nr:hypothetical protein [Rufibacter quisquiliarum]